MLLLRMKRLLLALAAFLFMALSLMTGNASARDVFEADRGRWMEIAEGCKPELNVTEVVPVSVVEAV